jgi:hypothetical protein
MRLARAWATSHSSMPRMKAVAIESDTYESQAKGLGR